MLGLASLKQQPLLTKGVHLEMNRSYAYAVSIPYQLHKISVPGSEREAIT